ncbi:MAG: AzlC family ABC transporter permease [Lachnospiraceae bacterium]|nr:AzlC family ABC transporter permease [Lachnospiraceae bacterium]
MKPENRRLYVKGLRDGVPIAAGYFAVAFSLGIMAKISGLGPFQGFLSSVLTNASAGEYAGFVVIAENSGLLMMALMTLVASARYFLMSCALSQHLSPELPLRHRLLIGFDVTDEMFGVMISKPGCIAPAYAYGLYLLPIIGWSSGTVLGIVSGNILPAAVVNALSVALYGMFIAIIVPPAKKNRVVLVLVLAGFALSCAFSRIPYLRELSSGTRTIILTVALSAAAALLFPMKEEEEAPA